MFTILPEYTLRVYYAHWVCTISSYSDRNLSARNCCFL